MDNLETPYRKHIYIKYYDIPLTNGWILRVTKFKSGNIALGIFHRNFNNPFIKGYTQKIYLDKNKVKELIRVLEVYSLDIDD